MKITVHIIAATLLVVSSASLVGRAHPGERSLTTKDLFGGFEGASLINPSQLGRNYFSLQAQDNKIYGAQGSLETWVCAGIHLAGIHVTPNEAVRIVVPNGNKGADLHAVYSYNKVTWRPVESQRSSFDFNIPLEAGRNIVYFATFYPYFYSQMIRHNRVIAKSRYAKENVIGKSVEGRPVVLFTITDSSVPASQKERAFLIGGTHGAETASIYGVEGMLNFLISNDPLAERMRRQVIWKIIPVLNVDAAAEGLDRRNAAGINLYYDWGYHDEGAEKLKDAGPKPDPSIPTGNYTQPETRAAHHALVAFRPQVFLDVHSWHFAGDGFWGPDPAATSPAVDALKADIARYFKIAHWDHESQPFASAPTVIKDLHIAATLSEFALSYGTDGGLKTPNSMRAQGVEVLRGAFQYLKNINK